MADQIKVIPVLLILGTEPYRTMWPSRAMDNTLGRNRTAASRRTIDGRRRTRSLTDCGDDKAGTLRGYHSLSLLSSVGDCNSEHTSFIHYGVDHAHNCTHSRHGVTRRVLLEVWRTGLGSRGSCPKGRETAWFPFNSSITEGRARPTCHAG
jgi:hypothetical protein